MDLTERKRSSRLLYEGRIIRLRLDEVTLPDGTYDGKAVVERTRPIEFLLEGR